MELYMLMYVSYLLTLSLAAAALLCPGAKQAGLVPTGALRTLLR